MLLLLASDIVLKESRKSEGKKKTGVKKVFMNDFIGELCMSYDLL